MPPAARITDLALNPADAHGCVACPHVVVGPIKSASPDVFINGLNAARVGDPGVHTACCGPNTYNVKTGAATTFINSIKAARLNDLTQHCGGIGRIITASPNVVIGDAGGGGGGGGKSTGGGVGTSTLKPGDLASAAQPEHVLNKEVAQVGDVTTVDGSPSEGGGEESEEPTPTDSFSVSITDNFSGVDLDDVSVTAGGSDVSGSVTKQLSPDGQKLTLDFEFEEGEVADDAEVRVEATLPDGTKIARSWKYKP